MIAIMRTIRLKAGDFMAAILIAGSLGLPGLAAPAKQAKTVAPPAHPSKLEYKPLDWKVPLGTPFRRDLPNKLKAYIAEDRSLPYVELTGYVYGGSLYDPAGKEGLAAFALDLMRTGGTARYKADSLDAMLDLYAIKLGLSADESQIVFSCSFLSDFTDTALSFLQQVLFHPAFERDKIDKERTIFIETIRHRFDNPGPILDAAYKKTMYPGMASSRLATEKSLRAIARDDLLDFHKRTFRTENMIIGIAGNFKADSMARRLSAVFPEAGAAERLSLSADIAPNAREQCLVVNKSINQCYIRLGLPLFKRPNADFYAVSVLDLILGGDGFTSRLGQKIRSDEGLTYSIHSQAGSNYVYPATWFISFFTKTSTAQRAAALVMQEIEKLRIEGVTDDELKNAKSSLIEEFPSMFRTPNDIVKNYAWSEYYGRSPDHYRAYPDSVNAVSKADILRIAQKYLDPFAFAYVAVGDTAALFGQDTLKAFSFKALKVRVISPDSLANVK